MTEHSVVYEIPGGNRTITRQVWEMPDGRILGSERIRETVWRGYDGWRWQEQPEGTFQFATREEASAWMDAMFCEKDVAAASASGARKALEDARKAWELSQPQLFLDVT